MLKHVRWLIAFLLFMLPASALAQDGLGIAAPQGWDDRSTTNLEHFVDPETGAEIFVAVVGSNNEQEAISAAIGAAIDPNFGLPRDDTDVVQVANSSIWAQNTYTLGGGITLKALARRSGNDVTWVVLIRGSEDALAATSDAFERVLLSIMVTPDNDSFLRMGLAATALILGLFILSLAVRWRNLQKDIALLDELARDEAPA